MFSLKHLAGAAAMLVAFGSQAVTITSYDILFARASGFAVGWNHTYNGTINSLYPGIGQPSLYSGGSGTLNDGLLADNRNNNQFF